MLFLIAVPPAPAFSASGNVPLDSSVYRQLDLLTSQGLLRSHLSGTRPITWAEAHRLMEEAREHIQVLEGEGREITASAANTLKNLEKSIYGRFTGDIRAGSGPLYTAVHDPGIELVYLEGDPSAIPGIKASRHALIYNNGGIDPDEGATWTVQAEVEGALGPFHLQVFPRLTTGEEDRELLHRGSFRVGGLAGLELNVARESLWWGQGGHGGLYLTSNASPLPMIHLSTPHPSVLPWIFRYLGPCRFEFFISRLEEDRAVPEPYFIGMRSNFRPVYELEIGMTLMAVTGGEGRPDVSFGDFFDILFGENEEAGEDRSNKIAGIDLRLYMPGYQIYLEFGGEDEAGGLPSKMAGMIGFYHPQVTGSADLRVEYTDLAYTEELAGVWYRHGIYTDGYTYKGRILGHHVGGGGRDLFAEISFPVGERGRGRLGVDLEQRGIHIQPEVEHHTQIMAGWESSSSSGRHEWKMDLSVGLDQIENSGYIKGETETRSYVNLDLRVKI